MNSAEKITPFGGFNFVYNSYKNSGLLELIENHLGVRSLKGGFPYSAIFSSHMAIFSNCGDSIENINVHLRDTLQQIPLFSVCSTDTILRGIKKLSLDTEIFINSSRGLNHEFNINGKLNSLLLKSACKTGLLKSGVAYDLDYDNTVIPTEKYDSKKTYKYVFGYQPGLSSIAHPEFSQAIPVYVEGRNGNSQAKYLQVDKIHACLRSLPMKISVSEGSEPIQHPIRKKYSAHWRRIPKVFISRQTDMQNWTISLEV